MANIQDCIEGSLDELDLSKLLLSASKNGQCLQEARSVFKRLHANKVFSISGPFVEDGENAFYATVNMLIEIRNFEVAIQFLHAFGEYIEILSVYFDEMDANEGKEIVEHINYVCTNSTALKSLSLQKCADNVLDELQTSFPSVSTLSFSSDGNVGIKIRSDSLKLVNIFPNVQKLFLGHTIPSDWKFIGKTFSYLKVFGVELESKSNQSVNIDEQVIHFLKHNSHIYAVLVFHSNLKFLKGVTGISPQFEQLKLESFSKNYKNYEGEPIHFNRLKFLEISSYDDFYPELIHFDPLQSISLFVQPEFNEKWSKFMNQQISVDIKSIHLQSQRLTNEQILAIAEKKPNLRLARFVSDLNITAHTVLRFINQSEYLGTLELNVPLTDDEEKKLIKDIPWFWSLKFSRDSTGDRAIITANKMFDVDYVDVNVNEDEDEDEEDNGSSALATHSMQSLTIALIYLITKL